jgi:type I restriction enzyme S subunit
VSFSKYEESPEIKIENGDVLLVKTGSTFGKTAIVRQLAEKATLNPQVVVLKKLKTNNFFLGYMMGFATIQNQISMAIVGGALPTLSQALIARFKFPEPPTDTEQRAIAGALGDVDTLLGALEKLIAKKRDLKQAVMQQLLTGQKRLPGFSGEWEVKRLGEIAMLYQPITISAKQFTESGYPVYGANGVVGFYNEFNHDTWQVTVTCRGSTCGTVNRTVDKCWITGNAMVVNCDQNKNLDKSFLYYVLLSQNLSVCITGTGQPQIVRGPLANVELKIPLDVAEQTAISEVLSDMDAEIAALEQRLAKTRALKQGTMQELLTGRTRLV